MTVDWLIGRTVLEAKEKPGGGWAIVFEDGARIVYDKYDDPVPDEVVGMVFQSTDSSAGVTTLYFGTEDEPSIDAVVMEGLIYGMAMADQQDLFYPEVPPESEAPLPEDPSPERVADAAEDIERPPPPVIVTQDPE